MAFDASAHYEELKDIMKPYVGTETGNDDFVFGNYIEWPSNLEDEQYVELINLMELDQQVWNIIQSADNSGALINGKTLNDYDTDDLVKLANSLDILDDVYDLLVDEGLPTGTDYENGDSEFPEEEKYY